jgi:hypothetical protein
MQNQDLIALIKNLVFFKSIIKYKSNTLIKLPLFDTKKLNHNYTDADNYGLTFCLKEFPKEIALRRPNK